MAAKTKTKQTNQCNHDSTVESEARCFSHSVAGRGRDEKRAAHGSITYTETCLGCGASRGVNQNQNFFEHGDWSPSIADGGSLGGDVAADIAAAKADGIVLAYWYSRCEIQVVRQSGLASNFWLRSVLALALNPEAKKQSICRGIIAMLGPASDE